MTAFHVPLTSGKMGFFPILLLQTTFKYSNIDRNQIFKNTRERFFGMLVCFLYFSFLCFNKSISSEVFHHESRKFNQTSCIHTWISRISFFLRFTIHWGKIHYRLRVWTRSFYLLENFRARKSIVNTIVHWILRNMHMTCCI